MDSESKASKGVQPARDPGMANAVNAAVRAVVGDPSFSTAKIGITIVDVETGTVLAAHNEHQLLNPASNAKLYTAAAALSLLHPEYRFETVLYGSVSEEAISGPLTIKGFGDPSLSTEDLWGIAQELRSHGVRRIGGGIVVDQSFFDEGFVPPAYEQQPNEWASFRAPVSALAANENTVTLTLRPGAPGQPALAQFDPPGFVDMEGAVTTAGVGADSVGLLLEASGRRLRARLSGRVGEAARLVRFTRRVEDPSLLGGYLLKAALEQAGVRVGGDVRGGGATPAVNPLVRHQSAPLSVLLSKVGKQSDNFYAEMVFKTVGAERKARPGRSVDAADVVKSWLERIGASDRGLVIRNGSGLFDANRVTAWSMSQLLRHAFREPGIANEFLAQLAIGGVDGTLHGRFRSLRELRCVRAKTGTLDDAIALSGYVLGPPGRGPVAFSVLFNEVRGKGHLARASADRIVESIVAGVWRERYPAH